MDFRERAIFLLWRAFKKADVASIAIQDKSPRV
jgi:hypothetical protein